MFERILDQRNEQQWCDRVPVRLFGQIDGRFHAIGQAQLHQFDVVADELNFLFERNVVLVVLVKHIAQHVAEAMHGELGFRPVGWESAHRYCSAC